MIIKLLFAVLLSLSLLGLAQADTTFVLRFVDKSGIGHISVYAKGEPSFASEINSGPYVWVDSPPGELFVKILDVSKGWSDIWMDLEEWAKVLFMENSVGMIYEVVAFRPLPSIETMGMYDVTIKLNTPVYGITSRWTTVNLYNVKVQFSSE